MEPVNPVKEKPRCGKAVKCYTCDMNAWTGSKVCFKCSLVKVENPS